MVNTHVCLHLIELQFVLVIFVFLLSSLPSPSSTSFTIIVFLVAANNFFLRLLLQQCVCYLSLDAMARVNQFIEWVKTLSQECITRWFVVCLCDCNNFNYSFHFTLFHSLSRAHSIPFQSSHCCSSNRMNEIETEPSCDWILLLRQQFFISFCDDCLDVQRRQEFRIFQTPHKKTKQKNWIEFTLISIRWVTVK